MELPYNSDGRTIEFLYVDNSRRSKRRIPESHIDAIITYGDMCVRLYIVICPHLNVQYYSPWTKPDEDNKLKSVASHDTLGSRLPGTIYGGSNNSTNTYDGRGDMADE